MLRVHCDDGEHRCQRVLNCTDDCLAFTFRPDSPRTQNASIRTFGASNLALFLASDHPELDLRKAFVAVSIGRSYSLVVLSTVVGWIYFFAWSISFYPQLLLNFRLKSAAGLSFDFLSLNITGFLFYAIYNVCLYFVGSFQRQYLDAHPHSLVPVELNDVVFALHAVLATLLTIGQCLLYERGGQTVSLTARSLLVLFWTAAAVAGAVTAAGRINALTFVNFLSYIKLTITLIKYIPQASATRFFSGANEFTRKAERFPSVAGLNLDSPDELIMKSYRSK